MAYPARHILLSCRGRSNPAAAFGHVLAWVVLVANSFLVLTANSFKAQMSRGVVLWKRGGDGGRVSGLQLAAAAARSSEDGEVGHLGLHIAAFAARSPAGGR
jgi:hypothetical protein